VIVRTELLPRHRPMIKITNIVALLLAILTH
jgi:hypothetical protein